MRNKNLSDYELLILENGRLNLEVSSLQVKSESYLEECKRLWALLDDISTCGDAYKPERNGYFKSVEKRCEKRGGLLCSNGYEITLSSDGGKLSSSKAAKASR